MIVVMVENEESGFFYQFSKSAFFSQYSGDSWGNSWSYHDDTWAKFGYSPNFFLRIWLFFLSYFKNPLSVANGLF